MIGPYETFAEVTADTRHISAAFHREDRIGIMGQIAYGLLAGTLTSAGVEMGAYDVRIADWLAGWEAQTVQVVIGWIDRARYAQWLRTFHAESVLNLMQDEGMTRAEAEEFLAEHPIDVLTDAQVAQLTDAELLGDLTAPLAPGAGERMAILADRGPEIVHLETLGLSKFSLCGIRDIQRVVGNAETATCVRCLRVAVAEANAVDGVTTVAEGAPWQGAHDPDPVVHLCVHPGPEPGRRFPPATHVKCGPALAALSGADGYSYDVREVTCLACLTQENPAPSAELTRVGALMDADPQFAALVREALDRAAANVTKPGLSDDWFEDLDWADPAAGSGAAAYDQFLDAADDAPSPGPQVSP